MKKRSFIGAAVIAATLSTAAFAQEKTLVVQSFPSFDEAVKAAIPLYKKLHPEIKIKLVSLGYGDHHNALVTALSTGAGLPDVAAVEVGFIGKFAESAGLEDLSKPPYNALKHKDNIVKYTFAQSTSDGGLLAAMPADIGPGALFLRTDVLEKAGVTEKQLTDSWDSYIEAGKVIKAKTGSFLVPNATSLLYAIIRSDIKDGDGIYFDKANKPLITTARFEKAFKYAKEARANGLDGKVGAWTNEWSEGFKRGTFATEMSGAWLTGQLSHSLAPDTKGKWRTAQLPGGAYASWGGSFYSIPKKISDEKKKMAWEFIEFMTTSKEMQLAAYKQLDAYPALVEAGKDAFADQPIDFLGGQKARQLWRTAAAKIPAIEVNKLDPIAEEIVGGELDKVLEANKDIKTALADAQKQIERRVRK
jgi:multiple sugar transport system substrate-binding protein